MSCLTNGFSDSTSPTTAVPIGANSTTTTALDSFISSILSAVTIDEPKLCTSCEDGATAKSKCIDCGVDLCDRCVKLHQRSCSTRNHRISRLSWPSNDSAISLPQNALNGMAGDPSQMQLQLHLSALLQMSANSAGPSSSMSLTQPNSNALVPSSLPPQPIGPPSHNYMLSLPSASSPLSGSGTSGISSSSPNYTLRPSSASTLSGGTGGNTMHICDIHKEPCRLFCQSCCAPACTECVLNDHHHGHQLTYIEEAADTARQQGRRLAAEARVAIASLREVADNVERTAHMIESGALQAAYDVRNTIRRYMIALEEREMNLLRMIDHTRQTKGRLIFTQLDSLRIMLSRLARTTDVLNECVDMPNPYDLISVNQRVAREIKQVQTMRLELGPCEEDGIMFLPPDANFMSAISSLGNITSSSAMVASRLARAQALKEQLFANFLVGYSGYYRFTIRDLEMPIGFLPNFQNKSVGTRQVTQGTFSLKHKIA
ncbi:unnamed protein product [Acanthoscelides obtectus]|uniref:B box-type domain-containing protein n=1 Tax=Acanthoscelides obtectus TaxID=200917 RepID=A0A9P0LEP4_ACAOB|nr:unnamed protein product [Acanthoscelides obtectus]CAK1671325.1 E3 ubiquitin-protein ligase TRIM71 [Acanthoscelides obtectus]